MCCCAGNDTHINGKPLSFSDLFQVSPALVFFYTTFPFVCSAIAITTISVEEWYHLLYSYIMRYESDGQTGCQLSIDCKPASKRWSLPTTLVVMHLKNTAIGLSLYWCVSHSYGRHHIYHWLHHKVLSDIWGHHKNVKHIILTSDSGFLHKKPFLS